MSDAAASSVPAEVDASAGAAETFPRIRFWPALILLAALWTLKFLPLAIEDLNPGLQFACLMGPILGCILLVAWWMLASRAAPKERLIGLLGLAVLTLVTAAVADPSLQGFPLVMYALPGGLTAFALAEALLASRPPRMRTTAALLAALLGFGFWALVRMDAVWGDFHTTRSWRWAPTAEEEFLRELADRQADNLLADTPLADPEWPGFRGPLRDSRQPAAALAEDWAASPPQERWRIPIGPAWSSFAVAGQRLFTQEQREDVESTFCLHAETGEVLWSFEHESRFWEAVSGAGPRATPTLAEGRLFALGANGNLHCLDPVTGKLVWQRDLTVDADRKPMQWGFSSSPLVYQNTVIVYAGGKDNLGMLAYDIGSGELLWGAPSGDHSYSSPHLFQHQGRDVIGMVSNKGLSLHGAEDGRVLANYPWPAGSGYRVLQPLLTDEGHLMLTTGMGMGCRLLRIEAAADAPAEGDAAVGEAGADLPWRIEEIWSSYDLTPDYNDCVLHQGYVYGFDRSFFGCIRLEDGKRMWKKGRYGNGQVLLLPQADQLLVVSEHGEILLVRATGDDLVELGKFQAVEGRTWNHPVLVGNRLYVRNGAEAACFEMPLQ